MIRPPARVPAVFASQTSYRSERLRGTWVRPQWEPPVTSNIEPVTQSMRSSARASTAAATSSGAHVQKRTGVWRDLAVRKRKTEVDQQVGVVVRNADEAQVPVPLNRRLLEMMHEIEDGLRPLSPANLDELARVGA